MGLKKQLQCWHVTEWGWAVKYWTFKNKFYSENLQGVASTHNDHQSNTGRTSENLQLLFLYTSLFTQFPETPHHVVLCNK